jgi:glycerophosphoryl diester phosphodiesterase
MAPQGLAVTLNGRQTRLKWHRLRRARSEGEFSSAVMAAGLHSGASMELDLTIRADGGFVVLHDDTLDRETTATGPVNAHDKASLAGVHYRQTGLPLILSEDLSALLTTAHPAALLQFDMKDTLDAITDRGLDHLAYHFGQSSAPIIFSGGCPHLIAALAQRLPHLPRGIDPTDRLVEAWQTSGLTSLEPLLLPELRSTAAPDTCYLNWELVLRAQSQGLDLIALCHAEGVKVDAWTYTLADPAQGFSDREWDEFSTLVSLGADQITTDEALATEAAWTARQSGETNHD